MLGGLKYYGIFGVAMVVVCVCVVHCVLCTVSDNTRSLGMRDDAGV